MLIGLDKAGPPNTFSAATRHVQWKRILGKFLLTQSGIWGVTPDRVQRGARDGFSYRYGVEPEAGSNFGVFLVGECRGFVGFGGSR